MTALAVEDMRDLLVEALNARDPDLVDQPEVPNADGIFETIEIMNERWPRLMMTRGDVAGDPVGVVWAPDESERYQQVAVVEIAPEEDGFDLSYVDEIPSDLVSEDPPGRTVAEWESATELDRGEGRWV